MGNTAKLQVEDCGIFYHQLLFCVFPTLKYQETDPKKGNASPFCTALGRLYLAPWDRRPRTGSIAAVVIWEDSMKSE